MPVRFRRFLLLLLLLTLPVQAYAYSAMQACMVLDRAAAEQQATAGAVMDMAMADCHMPEQPHSPSDQHECKFCAACALATALPMGWVDGTPVVPIVHRFVPRSAASFSGFIPDSLERPPRSRLA